MLKSGAEIVWEELNRQGVEVVFGYPGGAILPTYDAMNFYDVHHVLVRHEQGATHMADGYARASGRVGVAMATSGPGATNMVTGIATAMMDSSPIVCITGQVTTGAIGSDAFQETDVTGVSLPVTKHNYLVMSTEDLAHTIREAFHIARTGRPGPVLIDIPKDVQIRKIEYTPSDEPVRLPGYRPPSDAPSAEVRRALELINQAERPLILAGHGVLMAGAMQELREFAERGRIPVAQTLLGLGNFPASHPLCLGMMGMHGEAYVNTAIQQADLLLAFGMRFDDRVTGNLKTYAPNAKKIHVEIDPSELNKNVLVDIGIVGDLKTVLGQLIPGVERGGPARTGWMEQIDEWRQDTVRRDIINWDGNGKLWAPHVIYDLWKATGGRAITVTDVGQHQMWEAQYYRHEEPMTLITSGGLGTMGFALPAGIGVQFAQPDAEVWVVAGDGGFQMTQAELATVMQEKLPLKIAIINNGFLGMVRQWQEFFYEKRYAATPMLNPDFVKLAAAYDLPAFRVTEHAQVIPTIQRAREMDGPVLIDFVVEKEDVVYPMVPAGADLHNMIRRPVSEQSTRSVNR
ncbi:MAG TPA: biosynthetic-type acetolactate synthase large subunit [Chloroflexi bacterium]|nr:biosynthetic-type acetolactate synthase large subunit [Chloroflexota bacterium]